jgi:uncharacterized membrane protein
MYRNESKTGIKVYTAIFLVILVSFIGFIIYKGIEDNGIKNSKLQIKGRLKSVN